jgi:hypothetical protein
MFLLWNATIVSAETVESTPPDTTYQWQPNPALYSLGCMAAGLGIICARYDLTPRASTFVNAYHKAPMWDSDGIVWNFVLHPLWGSETYLRARERRYGIAGSLAFSMGCSITWEYLIESWIKHPSAQDLIFTTGIGWALGELRFILLNRLAEPHAWWLDPVNSVVRSLVVGVSSTRGGNASLGIQVKF